MNLYRIKTAVERLESERALVKARPSVSQARRQLNSWCGVCSLKPYYIVLQFLLSLSPNMRVCASLRLPSSSYSFAHPVSSPSLSHFFIRFLHIQYVYIPWLSLSLTLVCVCPLLIVFSIYLGSHIGLIRLPLSAYFHAPLVISKAI